MESLSDLLFELSNEDRLRILFALEKGPINLSNIARRLDFTAQGTSRNVARLVEISLIDRNQYGDYYLTSYGETALSLLTPFQFLSSEKIYILGHTTRWLPQQFVSRLGELNKSQRVKELLDVISNIKRERKNAEEYELYISPGRMGPPAEAFEAVEALKRGVRIRAIEPRGYAPSEKVMAETPAETLDFYEDCWRKGLIQVRHLDEVRIRLYMTDKEVAILSLPKTEGEVDMLGFQSDDPMFRGWCKDLFEYYWATAKEEPWFWTQRKKS